MTWNPAMDLMRGADMVSRMQDRTRQNERLDAQSARQESLYNLQKEETEYQRNVRDTQGLLRGAWAKEKANNPGAPQIEIANSIARNPQFSSAWQALAQQLGPNFYFGGFGPVPGDEAGEYGVPLLVDEETGEVTPAMDGDGDDAEVLRVPLDGAAFVGLMAQYDPELYRVFSEGVQQERAQTAAQSLLDTITGSNDLTPQLQMVANNREKLFEMAESTGRELANLLNPQSTRVSEASVESAPGNEVVSAEPEATPFANEALATRARRAMETIEAESQKQRPRRSVIRGAENALEIVEFENWARTAAPDEIRDTIDAGGLSKQQERILDAVLQEGGGGTPWRRGLSSVLDAGRLPGDQALKAGRTVESGLRAFGGGLQAAHTYATGTVVPGETPPATQAAPQQTAGAQPAARPPAETTPTSPEPRANELRRKLEDIGRSIQQLDQFEGTVTQRQRRVEQTLTAISDAVGSGTLTLQQGMELSNAIANPPRPEADRVLDTGDSHVGVTNSGDKVFEVPKTPPAPTAASQVAARTAAFTLVQKMVGGGDPRVHSGVMGAIVANIDQGRLPEGFLSSDQLPVVINRMMSVARGGLRRKFWQRGRVKDLGDYTDADWMTMHDAGLAGYDSFSDYKKNLADPMSGLASQGGFSPSDGVQVLARLSAFLQTNNGASVNDAKRTIQDLMGDDDSAQRIAWLVSMYDQGGDEALQRLVSEGVNR